MRQSPVIDPELVAHHTRLRSRLSRDFTAAHRLSAQARGVVRCLQRSVEGRETQKTHEMAQPVTSTVRDLVRIRGASRIRPGLRTSCLRHALLRAQESQPSSTLPRPRTRSEASHRSPAASEPPHPRNARPHQRNRDPRQYPRTRSRNVDGRARQQGSRGPSQSRPDDNQRHTLPDTKLLATPLRCSAMWAWHRITVG